MTARFVCDACGALLETSMVDLNLSLLGNAAKYNKEFGYGLHFCDATVNDCSTRMAAAMRLTMAEAKLEAGA